jgi:amino acid transporter
VRLLYGMGRDNFLPQKIFGHLNAQRGNLSYPVIIGGVMAYIGTLTMGWQRSVEILNFGALVASWQLIWRVFAIMVFLWKSKGDADRSLTSSSQALDFSSAL